VHRNDVLRPVHELIDHVSRFRPLSYANTSPLCRLSSWPRRKKYFCPDKFSGLLHTYHSLTQVLTHANWFWSLAYKWLTMDFIRRKILAADVSAEKTRLRFFLVNIGNRGNAAGHLCFYKLVQKLRKF
jgi:hypothetical protein